MLTVGYVGMTHLGLVSAIAAAAKGSEQGIKIVGYHPDKTDALKNGQLPVVEPDLDRLLDEHKEKITFTSDLNDLKACDIIYIAPDVPTNDRGESDLSPIEDLVSFIIPCLSASAVVVILSQVHPGFTRSLENKHALTLKGRLFYQVETLIFGRAVERALYPERFMVGTKEKNTSLPASLQKFLSLFECPIFVMSYESAELAKISINMYLVSTVTTTNMLAEVCEKVGAEWEDIAETLRLDKRIGPYAYLSPGLGLSGGNLERDLTTILQISHNHGNNSQLVQTWLDDHEYRADWALRKLHEIVLNEKEMPTIAVWGLAYKINTHSIKNSPSLRLLRSLSSFKVNAYDPVVKHLEGYDHVRICDNALAACDEADVLIVMTPWDEFKSFKIKDIANNMKNPIIIDPFPVFEIAEENSNFQHVSLGRPNKFAA